eukprot:CAMPEP_0197554076 /NCGR_PEP_ID=MMETSP1320-20131121/10556_1 /TAXON_ID=91990 /ORGANISM="Bolidomonas sp., Strain RCC2347" /LENGTH=59 /DNA_ID=CAMNT_0043114929 /DNA_START=170 /DNA_END=346 /DNA_ORIENTATION=+
MAPKRLSQKKSQKKSPSDFKRLKAKVGKRAPSRLNATSTEVKSGTLKMSAQFSARTSSR